MELLEKLLINFKDFFLKLDLLKRISLVILSFVIVAGLIAMIVWASKTRFGVLYSELNREDAKKIALFLEEKNISYQLSDDGKVIKIPEEMVEQWRIHLATSGVSFSGVVGYEVFDKQAFGTTSFVQKVNRQRALEGELTKTIMYIKGIKRARVHLSIPETSPFAAEKRPPGASVVLELDRGVVLVQQEIRGIASLVSSSVDGMRIEDVVILDHRGKKLSENFGDVMTGNTANRIVLESKMNRKFESQIENILSKATGEGKVVAKVNIALDFTESVSTKTSYDAENKTALSEVSNIQKINGSRPSPQGISGSRANLPGEQPFAGVPETRNNVDKESVTRNYHIPSVVTKSKKPTAEIKSITAAVMVDYKRIPVLGASGQVVLDEQGKAKMKSQKWSEADLDNFKSLVMNTIGMDEKRGDQIVIKNMEFAHEDLSVMDAIIRERENRALIKNLAKYFAVGLTVTLFFLMVVRPFIKWITDNTVENLEDFLPRTLEDLEQVQETQKLPELEEVLPEIEEKLNPEKIEGNLLKEKIISLVEENPNKAAQILQEMIHSGGDSSFSSVDEIRKIA